MQVSEGTAETRSLKIEQFKQLGNEYFKSRELSQASDAYSKAIYEYEALGKEESQLDPMTLETVAACYANRAQCNLVLFPDNLNQIKKDCDHAIELKPSYVKALFRRAKVLQALGNMMEAMKDLTQCLKIEPGNKQVRETAAEVRMEIAIMEEKNKRPDVILAKVRF